jgi:tRNA(fMet)-specific endonuclease VapC
MEKSIIDTDMLSYYLRGDEKVAHEIIRYLSGYDKLLIPIISYYEINSGLEYKKATKKLSLFKNFVKDHCEVLNLSEKSVNISSIEYGKLRRRGITIGTSDLLIAGISIANNLRLVTNNTKHYKSIESLKLSNWKA